MGLWGHYTVVHLNIMKSSLAFCLDFFINAFGFRPKTHVWFEAGKHLYTSVEGFYPIKKNYKTHKLIL